MIRMLTGRLPAAIKEKYRDAWQDLKMEAFIAAGKLSRWFFRPVAPQNADGSVNLHLGCGCLDHPAFVNIDGVPAPHVHFVRRIDDLSPFANDSVDLVYACHCLEHFSHRRLSGVLKEWHRVLKKGGVLRVSVPDFHSMVEIYLASGRDMQQVLGPITGGQNNKYNYHLNIFNEQSLDGILKDTGFALVRKWTPGDSAMTTFDDWSGRTISVAGRSFPISLNLEAVK